MRIRFAIRHLLACWLFLCFATIVRADEPAIVIDDFEGTLDWAAFPADGVRLDLLQDVGLHGKALRMDVGFTGGGYAVARKKVDLTLPENYAFTFQLRANIPVNHLEMKFLDASGENVWWYVRRDLTFPKEWQGFRTKKRQITFAWGPTPGELKQVAAVEIVVTAGSGGKGSVWIDDFELKPLPPAGSTPPPPIATATSAARRHAPEFAVDGDSTTAWQPEPEASHVQMIVDFGQTREFGGITIDWLPGHHSSAYRLSASDDRSTWRTLAEVQGGNGGRDYFLLPESECRYLRVQPFTLGQDRSVSTIQLAELTLKPIEFGASREAFFGAIAREAPRGSYPRSMIGEPTCWTVVGPDSSKDELLFSADGMIEIGKQQASIEPFLELNGRRISWADATITQDLIDNQPIPRVTWNVDGVRLTITPFDHGDKEVCVRYRIENSTDQPVEAALRLAVRPFQVNPPAQFLNFPGGTARLGSITLPPSSSQVMKFDRDDATGRQAESGSHVHRSASILRVDDRRINVGNATLSAATFQQGDVAASWLETGRLPASTNVTDPLGAASGLLSYPMKSLPPGGDSETDLTLSLRPGLSLPPGTTESPAFKLSPDSSASAAFQEWQDESLARWKARSANIGIILPASAQPLLESMYAQVGYILINRAGPAIQPGTRSYARSWIRDGSLTSSALLRLGHNDVVKAFLEWYAPHQYANGKIPCVVDWRGADPVPEHDSSGEFIFLVAEYLRYSGDKAFANQMWPRVQAAAAYLDSLRQERRTDEYRQPDKIEFFGLLPPSISHEGYSAKPMHSYWDDSFAYKGFTDAAWLAQQLGHPAEARRWNAVAKEFGADLAASIKATQKRHDIDYVAGCADLGDFDATSTTTFFSPTGAADLVPRTSLDATFERYWSFFTDRRGGAPWDAFTPYEVRNIGAFVHLGWRDRAQELATWFLEYQKPVGWRQWPEVVYHDETTQKFLGDLPHTWVGSDFVRSVLDMLLYVREDGQALVIGAGVPAAWLDDPAGVSVTNMPTPWGPVSYTMTRGPLQSHRMRQESDISKPQNGIQVNIRMPQTIPPDGIIIRAPGVEERVVVVTERARVAKISIPITE